MLSVRPQSFSLHVIIDGIQQIPYAGRNPQGEPHHLPQPFRIRPLQNAIPGPAQIPFHGVRGRIGIKARSAG